MRVRYNIIIEVDTEDWAVTLGEINDAIQDNIKGDPETTGGSFSIPRSIQGE